MCQSKRLQEGRSAPPPLLSSPGSTMLATLQFELHPRGKGKRSSFVCQGHLGDGGGGGATWG